jgi:hypothetical protein
LQAWIPEDGGLEPKNGDTHPDFDSLFVFQVTIVNPLLHDHSDSPQSLPLVIRALVIPDHLEKNV